ncbi:SDR family NAD(P)-dependent oxidoreductase [Nocardioides marmotae]|uniref:SDR family NAD(P)-dependent oxidoreductase n=1 Tax=Nocardioides marmotae TaxID=2663857 RepID=A0A6I3J7H3_9ACTN|nr:SDR family oxidoreductase [Nocardioides marmotae]MCR6030335.1 SDR family NAD(P)-dependent oxidoreductase [Gordonia jinghuaiqii]MBC9734371.1 SDR family oxidoreductase [Nocardioides marmotae]MTB85471.1 SDR family NAD(P)-dependent oxidoreductase [Nocardioides marmotae]MTB93969.1 SDR family NAD(P)-dependent oxidoreductase [Nocardioides marmotae]QKE00283.1 SDR family oxidoreductase [Nocardioides marmotae]
MENTSCVVTGAARGIGRGIAELMVARGHRVVVTDVDGEGAARTAREIGAAEGVAQDVRDPASHAEVARVAAGHGDVVAWFSNAGVGDDGTLVDLTEEQVRRLVEVNLLGAVWSTRAALAAFGPRGGDLVLTASLSGLGPVPGLSLYAATKAAVVSLASSVSLEAPRGVRVHALCPDGVDTTLVAEMRPDGLAKRLVSSGGHLLSVEETAQAAVDLVGSRRVVRTLPGWRGAAMRVGQLAPSLSGPALAVFAAQGRRRLR